MPQNDNTGAGSVLCEDCRFKIFKKMWVKQSIILVVPHFFIKKCYNYLIIYVKIEIISGNCHSEPTIVGEESYNVLVSKNYRLFGSASTSPLSDIKCCKKMGYHQVNYKLDKYKSLYII